MGKQLWSIGIAFVASVTGLGLIIENTTPDVASPLLKALFFLALAIALWCVVVFIFLILRRYFARMRHAKRDKNPF